MGISTQKIELWGGLECTINRVDNQYFDQLAYTRHYDREEDMDHIAGLGIRALRYPVLWERHQPQPDTAISWDFAAANLSRMRALGIEPILGLVHHGSGPAHVSFFDGSFEEGLARYAGLVAARFPDISWYTPVNEPLTTARFCGLYGHWYPHGTADSCFARILISECRATVLAMQAIRRINPEAKLLQTEDLMKVHSTPLLQYQARFENERRWLSYDLLSGNVVPEHPMWRYLIDNGIREEELAFFTGNPCPPDMVGLNHYITSERFLDESLSHYPPHTHGGNSDHRYADVEAVRVHFRGMAGPAALIREAWERFRLPLAITEAHLHCTRDEQLRWFYEIWEVACGLREEGVDIRAVTAWALLGSVGWDKLLTQPHGSYEPGAFDIRSGSLRPMALVSMLQALAREGKYTHPMLELKGWWHRDTRFAYFHEPYEGNKVRNRPKCSRPLLIIGRTGTLGAAFARICEHRVIDCRLPGRDRLDISRPGEIEEAIREYNPWAIINAAGYVRVDEAEDDMAACMLANATGPKHLATQCSRHGIKLITFSSDLVFDGSGQTPYVESSPVSPLNIYGRSKAVAEQKVLEAHPDALVIRTSAFFGPWDRYNFITTVRDSLRNRMPFAAACDVQISPTYIPDLVQACLDLLIDGEKGIWHLANEGSVSWAGLAEEVAVKGGYDQALVQGVPQASLNLRASRPYYSVLGSERGLLLPSLDHALHRYFHETRHSREWEAAL